MAIDYNGSLAGQIKLDLSAKIQGATATGCEPSFFVVPPTLGKFLREHASLFNEFVLPTRHETHPDYLCGFFFGKAVYVSSLAREIAVF